VKLRLLVDLIEPKKKDEDGVAVALAIEKNKSFLQL
jgi:hypothetical protein